MSGEKKWKDNMDPAPLPESSPPNGTLGSLSNDDDDGGENVSFFMPFFCQMLVNFSLTWILKDWL